MPQCPGRFGLYTACRLTHESSHRIGNHETLRDKEEIYRMEGSHDCQEEVDCLVFLSAHRLHLASNSKRMPLHSYLHHQRQCPGLCVIISADTCAKADFVRMRIASKGSENLERIVVWTEFDGVKNRRWRVSGAHFLAMSYQNTSMMNYISSAGAILTVHRRVVYAPF